MAEQFAPRVVDWHHDGRIVIWLAAGALVLLLGLLLLGWALLADWLRTRGRLRRCPRCWYDLCGTDGLRCPECGRDAPSERALHRTRRRWKPALAGLFLMVAAVALVGWRSTGNFNWNTVKPLWLLKTQAQADTTAGDEARKELYPRLASSSLSPSQRNDLVEHALAIQADPTAFWRNPRRLMIDGTWGDIVEEAWDREWLSDDQGARYARNAFRHTNFMKARSPMRQGAPLVVSFGGVEPRASLRWSLRAGKDDFMTQCGRMLSLEVAEQPIENPNPLFPINGGGHAASAGWRTTPVFDCDLHPGTHEVRSEWTYVTRRFPRGGPAPDRDPSVNSSFDLVRWEQEFLATVEVVPATTEVIERVRDDSLRARIEDAILIELIERKLIIERSHYGGRYGLIIVDALPVALGFDVFARLEGVEHKLGSFAVPASQRTQNAQDGIGQDVQSLFPDASTIDIILRPSIEPAERTIDIMAIWDGEEVVFEDVPLRADTD